MAKPHSIQELNQFFSEGETADQEIFAEQRSNVQLVAGEHYMKKGNKFWNRLRENKDITQEQKIRLTKNHIRKIVLTYRNAITSYSPGVQAAPKDKSSLQDCKTAELVNAVWADAKERQEIPSSKINEWAQDFIDIGEVFVKIFQDPSAGKFVGMVAEVDDMGQPVMDEQGQYKASEIAKFSGDLLFERWFGFNVIRPVGCKDLKKAEWLCHRKMAEVDSLKNLIDASDSIDPEEKVKLKQKITEGMDQTYVILDGNNGQYRQVKNQTMLKEWFFRPCPRYPMGYFYICTDTDIIFEGELPFGIFPIVHEGFDEIQTSPRSRSLVKQLRPNQVEINRAASKMAEHQITLGDDKVLIQNGTKLVPGIALPGVRSFQYSGAAPVVMQGRSGDQYLGYMEKQIAEMYEIANVEEIKMDKEGQLDVYAMLFRSIKDKKKFSLYTDKFENFLKNVFKTYIVLKQKYVTPEELIPAIGKAEVINIPEFKNVKDICYRIVREAQTEDSESKLGRQLALNHFIQYVGPQLAQKDLGKILRSMPYANDEMVLEDLTMEYDFVTNLILALDRGTPATVNKYVKDPAYVINRLTGRLVKADFNQLPPQVQQLYMKAISDYEEVKTQQAVELKQAQNEFIPTSGYLVACDFYVPDKTDPSKLPKRVRIPSEALDWLLKQMEAQGTNQETLSNTSQGALSDMSKMFMDKLRTASARPVQQIGQTSPGGM